jgi:hypothetical protein
MTDSTAPTTAPAVVATTLVTESAIAPALSFIWVMTFRARFIGLAMRFIMVLEEFLVDALRPAAFREAFFVDFFAAFLLLFPFAPLDFLPELFFIVRFADFFAISFSLCC